MACYCGVHVHVRKNWGMYVFVCTHWFDIAIRARLVIKLDHQLYRSIAIYRFRHVHIINKWPPRTLYTSYT